MYYVYACKYLWKGDFQSGLSMIKWLIFLSNSELLWRDYAYSENDSNIYDNIAQYMITSMKLPVFDKKNNLYERKIYQIIEMYSYFSNSPVYIDTQTILDRKIEDIVNNMYGFIEETYYDMTGKTDLLFTK